MHSPWNKLGQLIKLEAGEPRSPSNKGLINYYHNGNAGVSNSGCSFVTHKSSLFGGFGFLLVLFLVHLKLLDALFAPIC